MLLIETQLPIRENHLFHTQSLHGILTSAFLSVYIKGFSMGVMIESNTAIAFFDGVSSHRSHVQEHTWHKNNMTTVRWEPQVEMSLCLLSRL